MSGVTSDLERKLAEKEEELKRVWDENRSLERENSYYRRIAENPEQERNWLKSIIQDLSSKNKNLEYIRSFLVEDKQKVEREGAADKKLVKSLQATCKEKDERLETLERENKALAEQLKLAQGIMKPTGAEGMVVDGKRRKTSARAPAEGEGTVASTTTQEMLSFRGNGPITRRKTRSYAGMGEINPKRTSRDPRVSEMPNTRLTREVVRLTQPTPECDICHKTYSNVANMRRHRATLHQIDE